MSEVKALYIINNPITDFIEGFNLIPKEERVLYIKEAYKNSRSLVEAFIKEIQEEFMGEVEEFLVEKE